MFLKHWKIVWVRSLYEHHYLYLLYKVWRQDIFVRIECFCNIYYVKFKILWFNPWTFHWQIWNRYRLLSQKVTLTFERDPYFNMTSPFSSHNRRLVLYEVQFASYYHNKWKVVRLRTFVSRTRPLLEHAQSKLFTYLQ